MEFDTFLTEPKWQILELIATNPTSPVKISEKIGTSVAYVSQQLKLLEAARIITKKRTKATKRGKPRLIYSIVKDIFHITSLINKAPAKKKITPSIRQKIILKIWMLDNKELVYLSEKLFWRIEPFLEKIEKIYIDKKRFKVIILSKNKSLSQKVEKFLKKVRNEIDCEVSKTFNKNQSPDSLYSIYESEQNEEGGEK